MWDWSAEETIVDTAPDTNLPTGAPSQPTGLTLTSGTAALFVAGDGTVHSRIRVVCTLAADQFVFRHEVQFKKTADTNWLPAPVAPSGQNRVFISPVEDGVQYDVRVR